MTDTTDTTVTTEPTIDEVLLDTINEALGDTRRMTPYRMHKVLSDLAGKEIRPQMMYNYKNKKFGFKAYRNEEGHFVVDRDDIVEFFARFLTRQASKSE